MARHLAWFVGVVAVVCTAAGFAFAAGEGSLGVLLLGALAIWFLLVSRD